MTKYIVASVVVMVMVLPVAGWAAWRWLPATFTVKNESGQSIPFLTVEVAGKTFRYKDIPVGGTVSGSFHVKQEEVLSVRGQLADGTEFAEPCGYVVWEEFAPHVDVVVQRDGSVR